MVGAAAATDWWHDGSMRRLIVLAAIVGLLVCIGLTWLWLRSTEPAPAVVRVVDRGSDGTHPPTLVTLVLDDATLTVRWSSDRAS